MMLLLHVLMLSLLSGCLARVLINTNFEQECGEFFANRKPPTRFSGSQYKQICQTLNNVVHYATYYDARNRIPVYSAYKFEGIKGCKRQTLWFIEPQLDDKKGGSNMASVSSVPEWLRGIRQALNRDYMNSGYDRGHLAPVFQARSQNCSDATFTLTNAAPQDPYFNRVLWWNVENTQAKYLESQCRDQPVYIVTGVVPGCRYIKYKGVKRVNVPNYFWTAFCCLDQNNRCSPSGGFIGINVKKSILRKMTVAGLEEELQNLYGKTFRIFQ